MATVISSPLTYLAIVVVLGYYSYRQFAVWSARRQMINQYGCKPPPNYDDNSHSWLPSLYNMKQIRFLKHYGPRNELQKATHERFLEYGLTHSSKLFHTDMIFTVELENMKTILSSKFEEYEYPTARITSWQPLLGPGIFAVDGPHWQHSRKVISKAFMRDQVGDVDLFEDHVIRLIDAIPQDGKTTVDLQPLFFDMIMDSATEFLFGESTDVLSKVKTPASKRNHDFAEAWDRSQLEVMNGMMLPMYRFPKQFYADKKVLHEFVDGYVKKGQQFQREWSRNPEKAEAKGSGRYVLMHELSKNLDDPKQIRAELLNVLLASRDTTATLLSNVWWILARYPDVWTKIRKEIDDIVAPGERPTYDEVKRMTYIKYVCLETLRHWPLVPFNNRMASKDTVLPVGGGPDGKSPVFVPKGVTVNYTVWTLHHQKEYWGENVEDFVPERWETARPTWEYLPFHGGPRACLGQQYALTEATYTIVRMMQRFGKVEARDDKPWTESLKLAVGNLHGTKVVLTPM